MRPVGTSRSLTISFRVAQRGGRCLNHRDIPGQAGQGSEQPDLVVSVAVHCREVGLGDL